MKIQQKIGFDKILIKLKSYALSSLGKERIEQIKFETSESKINKMLLQTVEFKDICENSVNFPTSYFLDAKPIFNKIKIPNTYPIAKELLVIKRSLETIKSIIFFFENEDNKDKYPELYALIKQANNFPNIYKAINNIITKDGDIKNSASPELKNIRSNLAQKQSQVSTIIRKEFKKAQKNGLIEKNANISMRDGKLLIPVSAYDKNKVQGVVQYQSATGKTVFIEPLQSIEIHNQIRELEFAEKREIIKILISIANIIRPHIPDLLNNYFFLAEIDYIRAKALLAIELQAIKPRIINKAILDFRLAKHPLLFLSFKKIDKNVVPLDIEITEEQRIILISGPNAGGKSVALKTVALLQYMVQSGLLIPVKKTSKTGIFNQIFIDIGDEQSIENDLSTYSSHLNNMKFFLQNANENSLVLIDEFGTGTEPLIGGAIAESIMQELNNKQIKGIFTTHYSNLKNFAASEKGIVNAAMLFDNKKLQPLFMLEIGKPGSSFAFEIAKSIGLPKQVLKNAEKKTGTRQIKLDKHLQQISHDKKVIKNEKYKIKQIKDDLYAQVVAYREEKEKLNLEKKKIIDESNKKVEEIFSGANKLIENTIRDIKTEQAEKEATKKIRKQFEKERKIIETQFEKEREIIETQLETKEKKIVKQIKNTKPKKVIKKPTENEIIDTKITANDYVEIKETGSHGQIESLKGKNAVVIIGNMRTIIKLNKLQKISKNKLKKQKHLGTQIKLENSSTKKDFMQGLDVRGKRADEALQIVTRFIDDAIISGEKNLKILHGKGNGILKNMIREYLATQSIVRSCKDERLQLGGSGITLVELDY